MWIHLLCFPHLTKLFPLFWQLLVVQLSSCFGAVYNLIIIQEQFQPVGPAAARAEPHAEALMALCSAVAVL